MGRIFLVVVLILSVGCASVETRSAKILRFPLNSEQSLGGAPLSGLYTVHWGGGDKHTLPLENYQRLVRAGDRLGFRRDDSGTILAVVGDEEFPVEGIPASARYLAWQMHYDVPSPGAQLANGVLATGAAVGGFILLKGVESWIDDALGVDKREEDFRYRP
jgi:hypothetical protein